MWPLFYHSDMHFLTAKITKQTAFLLPLEISFSEWACDVTQVKKLWEWRNYILGEISLLHYIFQSCWDFLSSHPDRPHNLLIISLVLYHTNWVRVGIWLNVINKLEITVKANAECLLSVLISTNILAWPASLPIMSGRARGSILRYR